MKIVFMGTPDFAVPSLEKIISEYGVEAVFTQPDRPKGRGKKMAFSPVKEVAVKHDIKVFQPEKLKEDRVAIEYLKELKEPFKHFDTIDQYLDIVDKGRRCILFHYPIASWNGMNRKAYHIHGHIHNNYHRGEFLTHERALNAGVDINNFKLVKLEVLIYNNEKYKLTNL